MAADRGIIINDVQEPQSRSVGTFCTIPGCSQRAHGCAPGYALLFDLLGGESDLLRADGHKWHEVCGLDKQQLWLVYQYAPPNKTKSYKDKWEIIRATSASPQ